MPRTRRPENRGLPRRWQLEHGAYYYRVPPGFEHLWDGKKRFPLGRTLSEAHATFADRIGAPSQDKITHCGPMLDWYVVHVVSKEKNPLTKAAKLRHVKNLRPVFEKLPVHPFKPAWVYGYVSRRVHKTTGKPALTSAHREAETLSHAFTKLVQKGDIDKHPFYEQVRLDGDLALKRKNVRYVEDWEIVEALSLVPRRKKGSVLMIQAYIRNKLLTGLARSDLLRLRLDEHLKDDGIHVTRHKTAETSGKATIYDFDKVPERRDAVKLALAARPCLSPFLFCNKFGKGYIDEVTGECHGFDSMWQRFIERVLKETKVKRRFTEHDLRRKVASDADSLEKARALLQHVDSRTTQRSYRFKPERV